MQAIIQNRSKNDKNARLRTARGAGIAMSVGAVSLLTFALVNGAAFILNLGTATYYHDKLNFVARQAAAYTAGELSWCDVPRPGATIGQATEKTVPVVQKLLAEMGLPAASSIDVKADNKQATVTLRVKGIALGKGTVFPALIDLSVSASKSFDEDRPQAVAVIQMAAHNETTIVTPAWLSPPNFGSRPLQRNFSLSGGMGRFDLINF